MTRSFSKIVRSQRLWMVARDLRETLKARFLDAMGVARAVRHRLGWEKR